MVFVVLPHHSYYRYFYPLTTVVMWLGATKNRTFNAEKPPFGAVFLKKGVMPYQNRFPAFRKKNHLILRRITIGAYAMLPFRRATAYNSLIA